MTILTESAYVESKSVRDNQLAHLSHDQAQNCLTQIKTLYFALWSGVGRATTFQMVEFYEVSVDTVQKVIQRHREELNADGLKTLRRKELKDAVDILSIPSKTGQVTIWTPRAALRLGMFLRDSQIAVSVRTSLLDAVEKTIPAQSTRIRELELQLEVATAQTLAARAQQKLIASCSALAIVNPALPALILGKGDAVLTQVEPVEKTILADAQGKAIATYQGISKTKLAKRYGMKKASDVVAWLRSIGKEDLLESGLTATPCQYIPVEYLAELDALWASRIGARQFLIGE